jgi:hypothetical protein
VRPWSEAVQSDQNSPRLTDPYTLTHVTHGVLLFWLTGLLGGSLPAQTRVGLAGGLECAWEAFENTDAVIQRYRAAPSRCRRGRASGLDPPYRILDSHAEHPHAPAPDRGDPALAGRG